MAGNASRGSPFGPRMAAGRKKQSGSPATKLNTGMRCSVIGRPPLMTVSLP
jgi:hypothetical protein